MELTKAKEREYTRDATKMHATLDIAKTDAAERLVFGIASSATPDQQGGEWDGKRYDGDVVDPDAMADAIADYMQWANIREMHSDTAAGIALDVTQTGGTTYLVAHIGDDSAWAKVQAGIYKGFSIGGRVLKAVLERLPDGRTIRRILKLALTEISLVDRPANPDAAILLAKRDTMNDEPTPGDALEALAGTPVTKVADPMKVVAQIQQLRNEAELAGDLEGAARYTDAIGLLLIGAGEADGDAEEPADAPADEPPADDVAIMGEDTEPIAMAATPAITKVGRKIAGKRMALLKRALMDYAKALAEAGDEDAAKMLKALDSAPVASDAAYKSAEAAIKKMLQPIAAKLIELGDDVAIIKAQPVSGGPVVRAAGQAITKRLSDAPVVPATPRNDAHVLELKRLALVETNPVRKAQYEAELAKLASN